VLHVSRLSAWTVLPCVTVMRLSCRTGAGLSLGTPCWVGPVPSLCIVIQLSHVPTFPSRLLRLPPGVLARDALQLRDKAFLVVFWRLQKRSLQSVFGDCLCLWVLLCECVACRAFCSSSTPLFATAQHLLAAASNFLIGLVWARAFLAHHLGLVQCPPCAL
jgi:hypothetical protein